ncbi:MAG: peptidylprolyl isomerase, partial [Chloroflexi bacterium]|nr:peptidylprolyl isomerase [Chloroflexota bacterium]
AGQEGITATPAEIDRQVRTRILGASLVDDPSITDSEYRERYRRRLELLKVDEAQFRDVELLEVLRRKLDASLRANVPLTLVQRHLRVIQVSEIEDARVALKRIDGGEDFAVVATDVSRDTQTASLGGDLGWIPIGVRDEFDSVLFTLADNEVSAPLYGQSGVFIIQAIGEAEVQPVAERHRSRLEIQALNLWLLAHRSELVAIGGLSRPNGGMTTSRYNWVLEQLLQDRELFPRRTASG